jgi:hypothetical protein
MSTIANAVSAAGPWLFVLVGILALMSVAYGLYSDQGSGITTRERERLSAREQFEMWKRGTR